MQVPVVAAFKNTHGADMSEPIRCAPVVHRHKHELLRYLVLAIAFIAVVLLIAIALYYTQGSSIRVEHVNLVAPQVNLRA